MIDVEELIIVPTTQFFSDSNKMKFDLFISEILARGWSLYSQVAMRWESSIETNKEWGDKIFYDLALHCGHYMLGQIRKISDWIFHVDRHCWAVLTLYESCCDSGFGSHLKLTSWVLGSCSSRILWTGSGLVVTFPVAGHEATLPDTVFTTTWYVRPGVRFSVNLASRGWPRSMIWGCFLLMPMATWYRSNSEIPTGPLQRTEKKSGPMLFWSKVTL